MGITAVTCCCDEPVFAFDALRHMRSITYRYQLSLNCCSFSYLVPQLPFHWLLNKVSSINAFDQYYLSDWFPPSQLDEVEEVIDPNTGFDETNTYNRLDYKICSVVVSIICVMSYFPT